MLINPTYGAGGGSPTPSSGYVEDDMLYMADQSNYALSTRKITLTFPSVNINTTDGWTVELCLNINNITGTDFRIFKMDSIWAGTINLTTGSSVTEGTYSIAVFNAGATTEVFTSEKFVGGQHTISLAVEGTNIDFFFDGEYIETINSSTFSTNTPSFFAGYDSSWCELHNFRLYTRALTAAELAANHTNDVAKYSGNNS